MKYIRTKDGIFEFVKRFDLEYYKKVGFSDENIVRKFIRNGNKIADTIEELCDELIIKNPNNDGEFYRKVFVYEGEWKNILNEKHAKHCTNRDIYEHDVEIFGAIWTYDSDDAPTLKAVAKLNDKGELKLL